jgi:hypothetical protein
LLRFFDFPTPSPTGTEELRVSEEKKEIKVTDKRIFTPEGELREEYRFLQEKATSEPLPEPQPAPVSPPASPAPPAAAVAPEPPEPYSPGPALELPGSPPGLGGATFYDLVGVLSEPVAIYLGDVELPDGGTAENLEMARLHIDLLDVLRQKTRGNLGAQESMVLEDILYRSRMRYVQKRG